jgi:hypothetical protein
LAGKLVLPPATALFCRPTKDPNLMRFIAAVTFCLLTPAALAQDGSRAFKDWTVACDRTGYCSANTVSPPAEGQANGDYVLTVGRHAQQPYWEVSFATMGAASADQWADFTITIDSQRQVFSLPTEVGAYGEGNHFYFLGEGAQAVMDRFTPGTAVTVDFTDTAKQPREAAFSLAGLTAALIWIDEQQGRLGSERVAFAAPYGLVPIYAGDAVAPDIPLALLDRHRADPDCEPMEELANGRDIVVDELTEGYRVFLLPCQSGAYNFAQKVYVGATDYFEPQFFAEYQGEWGWIGTPFLWNAYYDPETNSVSTFAKARGVGDCGTQGHWQWNGFVFQLLEFRERECSDDIDPDAEIPEFDIVYTGEPIATETP